MCGIIGYVKGKKDIDKEVLRDMVHDLLIACQSRGVDATGYGYIKDGKVVVDKAPGPAMGFVERLRDIPFDEVQLFVGHTRAATKGSPQNNENNHPIVSKDSGLLIAHNGVVSSHKDLKQDGEVDSEVILRLIELRQDVVEGIKYAEDNYTGPSAYVLLGVDFPKKMYIVRSGNPMVLAYLPELDLVLFGSTERIIRAAIQDKKCHLNYFWEKNKRYEALFQEMDDDAVLTVSSVTRGISIKRIKMDTNKPRIGYWNYGIRHTPPTTPTTCLPSKRETKRQAKARRKRDSWYKDDVLF